MKHQRAGRWKREVLIDDVRIEVLQAVRDRRHFEQAGKDVRVLVGDDEGY